jgi:hypothetical protein
VRDFLPHVLPEDATFSSGEYAWKIADFPWALHTATALSYACVGGQFQCRLARGTCEMDWLNADSGDRQAGEPWSAYVARSCQEVGTRFQALVETTNFLEQLKQWHFADTLEPDEIYNGLVFVAYSVTEAELDALTHQNVVT